MSLFSVFDPVSYWGQINWIILFLPFLVFSCLYAVGGLFTECIKNVVKMMVNMYMLLSLPHGRGVAIFMVGLFFYLSVENLFGLFPFVFTSTAHPLVTLGFGVVGWLVCFLMGWFKNFSMSAAHLVPEGSPLMLSFLLVIIESISHLIRPFTLSIRLAANMMAGHLIIGLISSISLSSLGGCMISVLLQTVMMVLESGVALVQALVFSILLLLYIVEYY